MIKLFTIQDGEIVINRIEILTVPELKEILRRSKKCEGDSDGRKKLMAFKEFAYMYHMGDPKSKPNRDGMGNKQAHNYAVDKSGLDDNYKPDDLVKVAINIYKIECSNKATDTINELMRSYAFIGTVVKKVRVSIEELLDVDKLNKDQATELLGLINMLIEQSKTIPKVTRDLKEAINQLENDSSAIVIEKQGGGSIPSSADPSLDF